MDMNHECVRCEHPLTVREITERKTECAPCRLGFRPTMRGLQEAQSGRTHYSFWSNGRLVKQ